MHIQTWNSQKTINLPLSFLLVSGLYMHYHNLYHKFSCYLLLTNPYVGCICSCSYTDIGCLVIELASSNGPNREVSPTSWPEDGNSSSFRNIVFFRILDDGRSPKTQWCNSVTPPVFLFKPGNTICRAIRVKIAFMSKSLCWSHTSHLKTNNSCNIWLC
jgi:hypothetical protein